MCWLLHKAEEHKRCFNYYLVFILIIIMIKLTITKFKKNENYKEELKESMSFYTRREGYNPERILEEERMSVEITEEQFDAIRKVVLQVF